MLDNYEKVKVGQKAEKKALKFGPAAAKEPVCAYCKKKGHWLKDKKTRRVTCPKLMKKDEDALRRNAARRAKAESWQAQTSAKAVEGGGGGGWKTTGSSDKTGEGHSNYRKPVVLVSNSYDFGADEWNEIGAAEERGKAEAAAAEATAAEAAAAAEATAAEREAVREAALGRWNKPLVKEVVEEKTVDGAKKCPGCEDWGCVDCN